MRTRSAVLSADAALRDTPAAAGPLRDLLAATDATLPPAARAVTSLNAQLPQLDQALRGLITLKLPTVAALRSLGVAMKGLMPILRGFRFYGSDFGLGLSGVFASTTGEYDALGHYIKLNLTQSPQTLASGALSQLLSQSPLVPGALDTRTGLVRRCPGGNQPPAPDGSSPWLIGAQYCTASQDTPLSVDFP